MLKMVSSAWVMFLLVVAGCASTPTAQMDFDPGFDFSGVRTIAIQPIDRSVA